LQSKDIKIKIHRTVLLSVVCGCETWSLTWREEGRLRVFGKRVLRGLFGPKRDKLTGEWRRLNNEEICNLYCSPNIIGDFKSRRMRWAGNVVRMEKRKYSQGFWWGILRDRTT
jgi:hypothetical protein